ncbi:DUF692 domain-containing protein, partial [Vibrio sp. D173a]|uniref:DUF692 domain-containing protein n=1 Tax=Vibrio sp. D173a TaxID=2836349 RepID=UPI0025531FFA
MAHPLHPLAGVGLRTPHLDYFSHNSHKVDWLEIHSENYFSPHAQATKQLRAIRQDHQISCHGVGLSLGSVDRINQRHLNQLQRLVDDIQPFLVSDPGGHHFNDLLPLPYTEEALDVFCRNVLEVQDALQRPLLIENPSSYLAFKHSTIPEWEFLAEVQQRTECRLLLDFNNIFVSSFNHQFSCDTYLEGIPASAVDEIHLAGFTKKQLEDGEIWI